MMFFTSGAKYYYKPLPLSLIFYKHISTMTFKLRTQIKVVYKEMYSRVAQII